MNSLTVCVKNPDRKIAFEAAHGYHPVRSMIERKPVICSTPPAMPATGQGGSVFTDVALRCHDFP
ncbi:MAG: hypothetical protein WC247_12390 [Porticoccaceae bacterium]